MAGIFSIVLIYMVANKWFDKQSALFASATLAFLEYPIFYSQLARPYSIGLFFTLVNIFFWTKLFVEKKHDYKIGIGYGISIALAAYTHYFSFLTVIFMGLFGLFYLSRKNLKYYLIGIVLSIILYLPHATIFMAQIEMGGVGGWLGKPESDWIWEYLFYILNDSYIVLWTSLICFVILLILSIKNIRFSKLQIVSLILFLLPFLTGYFYSIYKNPVLQYSVLLFSFPFLILGFFSFFRNIQPIIFYVLLFLYSTILIYSTSFEKKYYSTEHFGEFKKIAEKIETWNSELGKDKVCNLININKPYYIQYYLPKDADSIHFEQYRIDTQEDIVRFTTIVKESKTPYLIFAWSNIANFAETIEFIKLYYPYTKDYSEHFNSEAYIFSKNNESSFSEQACIDNFESFEQNIENRDSVIYFEGKSSLKISKNLEYASSISYHISELDFKFQKLVVSLKCYSESSDLEDVNQVIGIENNGESKYWRNMKFNNFTNSSKTWFDVVQVFTFPDDYVADNNDVLKIYTWNKGKKTFNIDALNIRFYKD